MLGRAEQLERILIRVIKLRDRDNPDENKKQALGRIITEIQSAMALFAKDLEEHSKEQIKTNEALIVKLSIEGMGPKAIAHKLGLCYNTVAKYRSLNNLTKRKWKCQLQSELSV